MSGDTIEDTIAALDALNAPRQARKAAWLDGLRGVVARLDGPAIPDEDEAEVERPVREQDRRLNRRPEIEPDDPALPQRRLSRGGPWGPTMRERLVRDALRDGWW